MKRIRFRIINHKKNDISFYETKVKTWIGWVSFTVFYKKYIIHILSDPADQKKLAYERIYQYCKVNGYDKQKVEITEISKT